MVEQNNIEKVWYIENNELQCKNKVVSKVEYNNIEIAVLKEDRPGISQYLLLKDNDNNYWELSLFLVRFDNFLNPNDNREYCDEYCNRIANTDLKKIFDLKLEKTSYFNKCELAYISKYYPDIYEKALNSREKFVAIKNATRKQEEQELKLKRKVEVRDTNSKFKSELKTLKMNIAKKGIVDIKDFSFYKDNNYDNGITIQNNILYLAKQYDIKIPLATQGFINNRLVQYNFKNGTSYFRATSNNRCSIAMHKYLDEIYNCVKKELEKDYER